MKPQGWLVFFLMLGVSVTFGLKSTAQDNRDRAIPFEQLKSGIEFQQPETKALQADEFANPGLLWLEKGIELWNTPAGDAKKSCASCHEDGQELRAAASRYPAFDVKEGRLVNVEQRVNLCRIKHQDAEQLEYEREELLALTSLVSSWSAGEPYKTSIDGPAKQAFERGRIYYYTRRGQLDLACNQCHDQNWGQMLRGDRVSQGHPNGYPAYRFTWERVGSLHRRIRDCDAGVRAEPLSYGSDEYVALELYLTWRAGNLPIETPGVRR